MAEQAIRRGEIIVRVPKNAMMTSESAAASSYCGDLLEHHHLSDWQALCLHLLCERAAGDRSRWSPYLSSLPSDIRWHPLGWSDSRIARLRGSFMLHTLTRRKAAIQEDYHALVEAGSNDLTIARELPEGQTLVTMESMTWAAAILLSRGFYLNLLDDEFDIDDDQEDIPEEELAGTEEGEEEEGGGGSLANRRNASGEPEEDLLLFASQGDDGSFLEDSFSDEMPGRWDAPPPALALVPWADMLNHDSKASAVSVLRFNHGSQHATLRASRAYEQGDEVQASYGPRKSPADLLLDYGFVDPSNQNYWIEVPLSTLASPASGAAKGLMEAALGGGDSSAVQAADLLQTGLNDLNAVVDDEGGVCDPSILCWTRAAVATERDLAKLGWDKKPKRGFGGRGGGGGEGGDEAESEASVAMQVIWELEQPQSRRWERKMLETLTAKVQAQLDGYPTTLSMDLKDLEILGEATGGGGGGEEEEIAVQQSILLALVAEKKALTGTLYRLRQALKLVDNQTVQLADLYIDDE